MNKATKAPASPQSLGVKRVSVHDGAKKGKKVFESLSK